MVLPLLGATGSLVLLHNTRESRQPWWPRQLRSGCTIQCGADQTSRSSRRNAWTADRNGSRDHIQESCNPEAKSNKTVTRECLRTQQEGGSIAEIVMLSDRNRGLILDPLTRVNEAVQCEGHLCWHCNKYVCHIWCCAAVPWRKGPKLAALRRV